jgi:hypothetical protein
MDGVSHFKKMGISIPGDFYKTGWRVGASTGNSSRLSLLTAFCLLGRWKIIASMVWARWFSKTALATVAHSSTTTWVASKVSSCLRMETSTRVPLLEAGAMAWASTQANLWFSKVISKTIFEKGLVKLNIRVKTVSFNSKGISQTIEGVASAIFCRYLMSRANRLYSHFQGSSTKIRCWAAAKEDSKCLALPNIRVDSVTQDLTMRGRCSTWILCAHLREIF